VGVFALVLGSRADAASINHGNFMGSTVTYVDVTEASATDAVPLYGMPSVFGDSLDFNPVLFNALSQLGVPPVDLTDGQLTFMIVAKQGHGIQNVLLAESGVTTVIGAGTDATFTDVTAAGVLEIAEVDGASIDVIDVPIFLTFSHQVDGTWQLVTDGEALTLPWSGSQFIDIASVLTANNVPFVLGATKVNVNLNNGLIARSEEGTIAFIDKKDFGGLSVTVNFIPEPGTLLLALAGCLLSAGRISRRRTGRS
jgi:hypothetical protein